MPGTSRTKRWLLIAVAILGALFATAYIVRAVREYRERVLKAQQAHTVAQMWVIERALEAFQEDENYYPDLDYPSLQSSFAPKYVRRLPETDAWGGPFLYFVNESGSGYFIASTGSDRTMDQQYEGSMLDDLEGLCVGPQASPERDLILANGTMCQWYVGLSWEHIYGRR